jgi:hypothetical protein
MCNKTQNLYRVINMYNSPRYRQEKLQVMDNIQGWSFRTYHVNQGFFFLQHDMDGHLSSQEKPSEEIKKQKLVWSLSNQFGLW